MFIAAVVTAFAAWQFVMPATFVSVRGLNPLAVDAWRAAFRWQPPRVGLAAYTAVFRALMLLPFIAYGVVLWRVGRGARVSVPVTAVAAVVTILGVAIAMPASLSTDVFAYVGYGRLAVVHGLNPHVATQVDLVRLGDPTAPYLHWPIPSPYGPLWTLLSVALVRAAPSQAIWGVVVAMKLCAGVALLAAAAAARMIVSVGVPTVAPALRAGDRGREAPAIDPQPNHADAVFALVALNPLLLIEGPGNGHNDLVMIALVLAAFAALRRARPRTAALLVGVATAIKLIPLLLVPWLAVLAVRAAPPRARARLATAALTVALGLAPIVAAYIPFWDGPRALSGLAERWRRADAPAAARVAPSMDGTASHGSSAAPAAELPGDQGAPPPLRATAAVGRVLGRVWPVLLAFLWGCVAVTFGRGDPVFRLATVWATVALALMLFGAGMWFPWYLAWVWPVATLRRTRPHIILSASVFALSVLLMLAYALPPSPP